MANDDVTGGSGSGALREDMISNAVAFLKHPQVRILDAPGRRAPITSRAPCLEPTREISSHPSHRPRTASRSTRAQPAPSSQVTSSPEAQKRQFLEKKGLSAEEIDEAFKRAPQPAPAPAPAPASPVAPPAASVYSTRDDAEAKSAAGGLRWTQVVSRTAMAVGALGVLTRGFNRGGAAGSDRGKPGSPDAASAASALRETERALEEARVAAERSAKEAAASRARSDELARSLDDVRGAMERARADAAVAVGSSPAAIASALDGIKRELRDELRGVVAAAVADATASATTTTPNGRTPGTESTTTMPESVREELAQIRAMLLASPLRETPAADAGERDADTAYDADVLVPPSETTPRAALASSSGPVKGTNPGGGGVERGGVEQGGAEKRERATPTPPPGDAPPHPPSYMQVLEMLEKGQTPPGIRDIDDKPPDPDARIPAATMSRRRKPWEKSGESGVTTGGGDAVGGASGSPLSANGSAVEGGRAPGWRPPSVPSMSPDVSKVLMGRHGVGIPGTGGGASSRSHRGGWLAPGTPESEIQPAPGDLTPVKPSFDR